MGGLAGKVIQADGRLSDEIGADIGPELRRLRKLADMTQAQMADLLGVRQSSVSKIEKGGEVYLSTVKRYVEALGASLRVNAQFPIDGPIATRLCEVFDIERTTEDQLVLPLLGEEPFKPQRDVVLSIKPVYSEKILEGRKTVELRRRFPVSAPDGTLAYIYSTSPVKAIVGTAEIKKVLKLSVEDIWNRFESHASIERDNFDQYFEGLDFGYALVFDQVRALSRPWPLDELRERFSFEPPQSFLYAKRDLRRALQDERAVVSH